MSSYPDHLVRRAVLADGSAVVLRPIRPDDAALVQQFVRNLSDESRYFHGHAARVLATNGKMLRFAARLGFSAALDGADPRVMRVELPLHE